MTGKTRSAALGFEVRGLSRPRACHRPKTTLDNKQIAFCPATESACGGGAPGSKTSYDYDGDGNRVRKLVNNAQASLYVYNAFGNLAAEYTDFTPAGPAGTQYRTTDHLGSTRVVTDATTPTPQVLSRRDFFPFGEEIPASATYGNRQLVTDGQPNTTYNDPSGYRQQFTGKERDGESELDYFGARYFGASLGRFNSPDPLGGQLEDSQTLNKYTYVRNNPLAFTDPTGLYVCGASVSLEQCSSFETSRTAAQAAADQLKSKYGTDSKKYLDAQRAIDAYGAAGVDNGVTIEVAANSGKSTVDLGSSVAKTADNPTGQNITSTFDPGSLGKGSPTAGLIAHEGTHVADASDWVKSGFSEARHPNLYTSEFDAYRNQTSIFEGAYLGAVGRGEGSFEMLHRFTAGGNTRFLWFPGWSDASVANAIKGWLAIPPSVGGIYGLTPASKTLMFSRPRR